jgi:Nucleoside 2-deoxyribosyltransferase like
MALCVKPPAPLPARGGPPCVFLAGSIEMGGAADWQAEFERSLRGADVTLLNPRRDDWDPAWEQSAANPPFRDQVEWELAGLERADLIAMYFDPPTKSPVTLLELGLFAGSGKLVVCCPEGFWRKGNVDLVCARYGVPAVASLPGLIREVRRRLGVSGAPEGRLE